MQILKQLGEYTSIIYLHARLGNIYMNINLDFYQGPVGYNPEK